MFRTIPEAIHGQFYFVLALGAPSTGSADYVLLVTASDIASFDNLMSEMIAANPNVRRFTTNVVMGTIKRGLFVPVD